MLSSLINEFINLQTNGIAIIVDSVEITIYFALGLVLSDNLGLNQNWKLYILLRQIVDLCCARRI